MEIKRAVRHAVPMIVSISGVSGSGKTYSGLLLAAGLAGPGDKIGFLDTENGRGSMYADEPGIVAAMPQGYDVLELAPKFHPTRYIEAIDKFENAGYKVLVIDSASHAWEGEGGCTDIAEADNGRWNKAKLANKRLVTRLLSSNMHIVVCLRAREKSKIISAKDSTDGKEHTISLGVLPISEKNFPFEMLLSFRVEEEAHIAVPVKCPKPLEPLFPKPRLLTKEDGKRIREWNQTGAVADLNERLFARARASAENGLASYSAFFEALTLPQKKLLRDTIHAELKAQAETVDLGVSDEDEGGHGSGDDDEGPTPLTRASFGDEEWAMVVPYLVEQGADSEDARNKWLANWDPAAGKTELLARAKLAEKARGRKK